MPPKRKNQDALETSKKAKGVSTRKFKKVLDHITEYVTPEGEYIATDFLKLPPKKVYPEYYEIIAHPISLLEISKKVAKGEYDDDEAFLADFRLLADNCGTFNDPESAIAGDSRTIAQLAEERLAIKEDADATPAAPTGEPPREDEATVETAAETATEAATEAKAQEKPAVKAQSEPVGSGVTSTMLLKFLTDLIALKVSKRGTIAAPFLTIPSATEYPDYHEMITEPRALETVREKIVKKEYATLGEFAADMNLIWRNAQTYNADDSAIFRDAGILERSFRKKLEKIQKDEDQAVVYVAEEPAVVMAPPPAKRGRPRKEDVRLREEQLRLQLQHQQEDELELELELEPEVAERNPLPPGFYLPEGPGTKPFILDLSLSSSKVARAQQLQPGVHATNDYFEYRLTPGSTTYALNLPPHSLAVSVVATVSSALAKREYTNVLMVNNERVAPSPLSHYADEDDEALSSRYEIKLAMGLNQVEFVVLVAPVVETDETGRLPSRSAVSGLGKDVEKRVVWVNVAM